MTILTHLKELAKKAAKGPWHVDGPKPMVIDGNIHRVLDKGLFPSAFVPAWDNPGPGEEDGTEEARANAEYIAALLNAAPALLRVAEAAKTYASNPEALEEALSALHSLDKTGETK